MQCCKLYMIKVRNLLALRYYTHYSAATAALVTFIRASGAATSAHTITSARRQAGHHHLLFTLAGRLRLARRQRQPAALVERI